MADLNGSGEDLNGSGADLGWSESILDMPKEDKSRLIFEFGREGEKSRTRFALPVEWQLLEESADPGKVNPNPSFWHRMKKIRFGWGMVVVGGVVLNTLIPFERPVKFAWDLWRSKLESDESKTSTALKMRKDEDLRMYGMFLSHKKAGQSFENFCDKANQAITEHGLKQIAEEKKVNLKLGEATEAKSAETAYGATSSANLYAKKFRKVIRDIPFSLFRRE